LYLLDANVIVRFLTNDDEKQAPVAYRLIEEAINGKITLVLHSLIVAKCCWVLESKRYGYSKSDVAEKLDQIVSANSIKTIDKETIKKALQNYREYKVDFVDAYLHALVENSSYLHSTITWNVKDFKRMGAEFYTPDEILKGV
jgi:predicted nucleic-acid-binding protein